MTNVLNDFEKHTPIAGDRNIDELNKLLWVVQTQDDRGLILSLATFAEESLGRLLLTYLREKKQARELVEGFNAPLGTFSARIKAAFALGLLTRNQYEDLEISRKIRNLFAHNWQGITFDRQDISVLIERFHVRQHEEEALVNSVPKLRLYDSITRVLLELQMQIGDHEKYGTQVPLVGFQTKMIKIRH